MSQSGVYADNSGGGGGTGILSLVDNDNTPVLANSSNQVYLVGNDPFYTESDPVANTITIKHKSNYKFITETSTSTITLGTVNAYICKAGTQNTFVLPTTAEVGDTYKIVGYNGSWRINQHAGQKIVCGMLQTTAGSTGYVTSTAASDQLEIVCVTNNQEFYVIQVIGNPSFN